MKLRCLAIDDEELALELLVDNISKLPFLELIGATTDPFQALEIVQKEPVDLIFLDIQMPGLTGIQFIKSLPQQCLYIFVTAYDKYALEGFNLQVVDYLLKPVSIERFIQAAKKAQELFKLKQKEPYGADYPARKFFWLQIDYSHVKVLFDDIMYIEGLKDYVKLHLQEPSKPLIARISMKALEMELPETLFLRIHKSFIVSANYISAVRKNSVFIGNLELPIGENYKEAVAAFIGNSHSSQSFSD